MCSGHVKIQWYTRQHNTENSYGKDHPECLHVIKHAWFFFLCNTRAYPFTLRLKDTLIKSLSDIQLAEKQ